MSSSTAEADARSVTPAVPPDGKVELPSSSGARRTMLRLAGQWRWIAACVFTPPVLFMLVRPDWFYISNGLDPYFYTGYAQNLGDLIAMSADRHYFVSRWTAYLPNRVMVILFGPTAGYLALRWATAILIAGCIAALGHRRWRKLDTFALIVFALLSPVLLRAVLNDYVDSLTAPLGILAIVIVSLRPERRLTAAVVGVCAAAIGIANPIAAAMIMCLVPAWLLAVRSWRTRAVLATVAGAAALAVVGFGLLLFRTRYGIPNVYQPTLTFMKENSTYQDPLKSTRLWWMGYRLWIYVPMLVLLAWWYLARRLNVVFDRAERTILITCAVQYGFQTWYQFSRHGSTLEIPYYWSIMVPSLVLGVVVILGKLSQSASRWALPAAIGGLALFASLPLPTFPEVYSSWIDALIVGVVLAAIWQRLGKRGQPFAMVAFVFLAFTLQAGAPRGEPVLAGEMPIDASYEFVYDDTASEGIDGFHAATWFSQQMDTLGTTTEQAAYFWIGGANAHRMAAMYSAHVDGRWMNPGWGSSSPGLNLSPDFEWAVQTGIVDVIAMLGTPDEIATMTATLEDLRAGFDVVLDGQAPDRLQTALRVVSYSVP